MSLRERENPFDLGILHAGKVTKLDRQWGRREYAARSRDDGFFLAIEGDSNVVQQVLVGNDGSMNIAGDYADSPAPYLNNYGGTLDGEGRLWQIGGSSAITYAVFYRPVAPKSSKVVYSADVIDTNTTIDPPRAYINILTAKMFTGP